MSKIEELFEAAHRLCFRIEAEGGHGFPAHELNRELRDLLPAARAEWERAKRASEPIQDERNSDESE